MFAEILKKMIKEEWRIHTCSFDNKNFAFFPVLIAMMTAVASLFIPYVLNVIRVDEFFKFVHYFFMFFGVSIGAFGLFGKEIMNRRFGQASLIAYSSRSLPVSERTIFFAFFVKDVIYYLILWIIPIFVAFLIISPFIGFTITSTLYACTTLILSFLIGLSLVFLLSTIYAHSSKILVLILTSILGLYSVVTFFTNFQINFLLLSYNLYYKFSLQKLGIILMMIIIPSLLSIIFVKIEYPEKKKYHKNLLTRFSKKLKFSKYSYYIAKDFIDLKRSEGGLGKIIFSFLLPIGFTYFFLSIFLELIPMIKVIMIFSIFLGIVSTSIYNMITVFDTFNSYMFLPVRVSTIIKSKITSFIIINIISLVVLIIATITMNQLTYFIPAFLMFLSITIASLAVTVFLTGLNPNTLLYDSKVFIPYMGTLGSMLFLFTLLSIINPFYMLASPIVIPFSLYLLKKSYNKWDLWTPYNL